MKTKTEAHLTSEGSRLALYLLLSKRHINNRILCLKEFGRGTNTKFLFTGAEQACCCTKIEGSTHNKPSGGKQLMWKLIVAACVMDADESVLHTSKLETDSLALKHFSFMSVTSSWSTPACVRYCKHTAAGGQ